MSKVFVTAHENGDTQVYLVNGKVVKVNEFDFKPHQLMQNEIHAYFVRQTDWVQEVLKEGAGIILNINTVKTVYNMGPEGSIDSGHLQPEEVTIKAGIQPSADGNFYYLIQDKEMGRGMAILMKISPDGKKEIIEQEHRDTVRTILLEGEFIRSFGIDYNMKPVADLNKLIAQDKK